MKVHIDFLKERIPDLELWQLANQADDDGFITLSTEEAKEYRIVNELDAED